MTTARKAIRPLRDFLRPFAGPAIWFAHFSVLYGAETLACLGSTQPSSGWVWSVVAATVLALLALASVGAGAIQQRRSPNAPDENGQGFFVSITLLLVLMSFLGIAWTTLGAILVPVCAIAAG
jgi:hypothetical protein